MLTHHVTRSSRLLDYLLKNFPDLKKARLKQFLKYGSVTVNGVVTSAFDQALKTGDVIDFLSKQSALQHRLKKSLSFPIIYEDEALLVIDKPAGLLTMGTDRDKIHTAYFELMNYVRSRNPNEKNRIFIVHRLDRDSSGLVLFAKSALAKRLLQENWANVCKKYYAIVEGVPRKRSGTIESYLTEDDKSKRVYSTKTPLKTAKRATTRYTVLRDNSHLALLGVSLITGRKNQIRVHLADLGHPIVGDIKYGAHLDPAGRLGLHAYFLSFPHPLTGKNITLESKLPNSLEKIIIGTH